MLLLFWKEAPSANGDAQPTLPTNQDREGAGPRRSEAICSVKPSRVLRLRVDLVQRTFPPFWFFLINISPNPRNNNKTKTTMLYRVRLHVEVAAGGEEEPRWYIYIYIFCTSFTAFTGVYPPPRRFFLLYPLEDEGALQLLRERTFFF